MKLKFPSRIRLRILVALVLLLGGLGAVLILLADRQPVGRPIITVLDPRLQLLWVKMVKGSRTYYLPKDLYECSGHLGSCLEGDLRRKIRAMGFGIRTLSAFTPGNGTNGRAFWVGYVPPDPSMPSEHLMAEVVGQDGAVYPLRSAAGGGGGPPTRSWNLWMLDSLPAYVTNYALRLTTQTNGPLVAEIRFEDP